MGGQISQRTGGEGKRVGCELTRLLFFALGSCLAVCVLRSERLLDIIHQESKLYLVFEFLDLDLKKYMDTVGNSPEGLGPDMVRVSAFGLARGQKEPEGDRGGTSFECTRKVAGPIVKARGDRPKRSCMLAWTGPNLALAWAQLVQRLAEEGSDVVGATATKTAVERFQSAHGSRARSKFITPAHIPPFFPIHL